MNKSQNRLIFLSWVTIALLLTGLIGLVFAGYQHAVRSMANDPQIELAEEVTKAINNGAPIESILSQGSSMDMRDGLAPFAMIFDKDRKLVGSTAKLGDNTPEPPQGTFEFAKEQGRNMFTWSPEEDVRVAAVVLPAKDSYVLIGKNLREVDLRTKEFSYMALGAWMALLGLSAILAVLLKAALSEVNGTIEKTEEVIVIQESAKDESQI